MPDLPAMVQDKYRTCQTMCFCGVFPEIRRAWASVDNSLFLWRYDRRWGQRQWQAQQLTGTAGGARCRNSNSGRDKSLELRCCRAQTGQGSSSSRLDAAVMVVVTAAMEGASITSCNRLMSRKYSTDCVSACLTT